MSTAASHSDRWTAVALLAMSTVLPAAILYLYFFTTEPVDWRHRLEVAMEPEGGARMHVILLATGAIASALAAALIAFSRHRIVLRVALVAAVGVTLSYAISSMWLLVFVSVLPLWWAYKVAA